MKNLLAHLIDVTAQPDRQTMVTALAQALCDIAHADQCEVFSIGVVQGARCIRRRAHARAAAADASTAMLAIPDNPQPLTHFPVLANCIEQEAPVAQEMLPASNQVASWIPLRDDITGSIDGCIRMTSATPLAPALLLEVQAVLVIYRNFTRLLDDNELDSLTGLLNRKTFDRRFAELVGSPAVGAGSGLIDQAQPERRSMMGRAEHWLAVIDIDHFKKVNDQFGHVYGDEVLILLANILKTSFREQDRVYRFGGEEFVVLLRSTTLEDARTSFERLRTRVAGYDFPQIKDVTISLGFASISSATPVAILGQADQALYFAKENGRNQVILYDDLVTSGKIGSLQGNQDADFF